MKDLVFFLTKEKSVSPIANYIYENLANVDKLSLKIIAESTYCSQATVVRYFKKRGFKGYREFYYKLMSQLEERQISLNEGVIINRDISGADLKSQFLKYYKKTLLSEVNGIFNYIEIKNLSSLINKLKKNPRLLVFYTIDRSLIAHQFALTLLNDLKYFTVVTGELVTLESYINLEINQYGTTTIMCFLGNEFSSSNGYFIKKIVENKKANIYVVTDGNHSFEAKNLRYITNNVVDPEFQNLRTRASFIFQAVISFIYWKLSRDEY